LGKDYTYWKCKFFGHKPDIQVHISSLSKNGRVSLEFIDICQRKKCSKVFARFKGEARFKTKDELRKCIENGECITIETRK
jgi:hypothetical protein